MSDEPGAESRLDARPYLVVSAVGAVLALATYFGLASGAPLLPFVGRFHPLVVHLPIGVVFLAFVVEAAALREGVRRKKLEPALTVVLTFLVVSAVAAFVVGLLLGRTGDYPQKLLGKHRTLTLFAVLLSSGVLAAFAAHKSRGLPRPVYQGLLVLTIVVMGLGGHVGGSLSRGEGYLFELAPSFVQDLAGYHPKPKADPAPAAPTPTSDPLVWDAVVFPALKAKCGECHLGEKKKGGLRVDTIDDLVKGGLGGPAIVRGDAQKSPLVERTKLPKDSDDHMPPDDKPGFSPAELAAIEFFIDRGAPKDLKVKDALAPPAARGALEAAAGPAKAP